MLALVVVIDLGVRTHLRSDFLDPLFGHRHRRQRACAHPFGRNHAHPADSSLGGKLREHLEHTRLALAQHAAHRGKRLRHQGEAALKLVQQAKLQ